MILIVNCPVELLSYWVHRVLVVHLGRIADVKHVIEISPVFSSLDQLSHSQIR